jgi:hypothetical protein
MQYGYQVLRLSCPSLLSSVFVETKKLYLLIKYITFRIVWLNALIPATLAFVEGLTVVFYQDIIQFPCWTLDEVQHFLRTFPLINTSQFLGSEMSPGARSIWGASIMLFLVRSYLIEDAKWAYVLSCHITHEPNSIFFQLICHYEFCHTHDCLFPDCMMQMDGWILDPLWQKCGPF